MKIGELWSRAVDFIERGLWRIDDTPIGGVPRKLFGLLRIIVITVQGFIEDKAMVRASALTYFSLLSIVPVLALVFAIAKGFGLEEMLMDLIQDNLGNGDVSDYLISFADNMLSNTRGGIIAGVGVVMLFYSVFNLLSNIEDAFNNLWCIKTSRTWSRKLSDYMCMMIFGPILVIVGSSATVFVKSALGMVFQDYLTDVQTLLINLSPYVLMSVTFALLFMVMPNTKVQFRAAAISGIVTGTAYVLVQWIYITFQIGVNKAGAVYGSFAFLPLLLAWLQLTWTIVLVGCKVAFSIQNVSRYSLERGAGNLSNDLNKKLAALVMLKMSRRMVHEGQMTDGLELANELEVSQSCFYNTIERLKRVGLVAEVSTSTDERRLFVPAVDVHSLSVASVCARLDSWGADDLFHIRRDDDLAFVEAEYANITSPDAFAEGSERFLAR